MLMEIVFTYFSRKKQRLKLRNYLVWNDCYNQLNLLMLKVLIIL